MPPAFNKGKDAALTPKFKKEYNEAGAATKNALQNFLNDPKMPEADKRTADAMWEAAGYEHKAKNWNGALTGFGELNEHMQNAKVSVALGNANIQQHQYDKHFWGGSERSRSNASFFNNTEYGAADKPSTEKFLKNSLAAIMNEHVRQGKPLKNGGNFDGVVQIGGIPDKELHNYTYDPKSNGMVNPGTANDLKGGGTPYVKLDVAYDASKHEIGHHGYPINKPEYDRLTQTLMKGEKLTVNWPK